MEMDLDDKLPQGATWDDVANIYGTQQYLVLCRERLLRKVIKYKETIEQLKTEKVELAAKHRKQLETVRTFYHNMTYGLSRSSVILQNSLSMTKY